MIKNIKKNQIVQNIQNLEYFRNFENLQNLRNFQNVQIFKKFITYLKRPKEVKFPKTFGLGGGETFPLLL